MRNLLFDAVAALIATAAPAAKPADPYLWLENVEGAKALTQVKRWNAETEAVLTAMPGYEQHRARALAMLNDPRQIAMPDAVMGDLVANHWVDAEHKRGLWRVSPLNAYLAGKPEWRVLIDVDALGKAEASTPASTSGRTAGVECSLSTHCGLSVGVRMSVDEIAFSGRCPA